MKQPPQTQQQNAANEQKPLNASSQNVDQPNGVDKHGSQDVSDTFRESSYMNVINGLASEMNQVPDQLLQAEQNNVNQLGSAFMRSQVAEQHFDNDDEEREEEGGEDQFEDEEYEGEQQDFDEHDLAAEADALHAQLMQADIIQKATNGNLEMNRAGFSTVGQKEMGHNNHEPKLPTNGFDAYQQLLRGVRQSGEITSEKFMKRQYFKAGRTGNIEVFNQVYSQTLVAYMDPLQFITRIQDPEGRNMLVLCLINGNHELLKHVTQTIRNKQIEDQKQQQNSDDQNSDSQNQKQLKDQQNSPAVDLEHVILNQSFDGNPALNLALCTYAFESKYVQRCESMLSFLTNVIAQRSKWLKANQGKLDNQNDERDKSIIETLDIDKSMMNNVTNDDYGRFANIRDRIGRTVLHLCCFHGVDIEIIKNLVENCGANIYIDDIEGRKPVEYAVQFNQVDCFDYLIEPVLQNLQTVPATQQCNGVSQNVSDSESQNKIPNSFNYLCHIAKYAVKLAGWNIIYSFNNKLSQISESKPQMKEQIEEIKSCFLDQALKSNFEQQLKDALSNPGNVKNNVKKTFIVTDKTCLQHAGFQNYANVQERVMQKDNQPENAERLMVLIDQNTGALTKAREFKKNDRVTIKEVSKAATIADVIRIHDYRYIKRVINKCEQLYKRYVSENDDAASRYDNDSHISASTWTAALQACGAVIEACDQVMTPQYRNAFCAIRPPGHHAGVFGKTFKNNVCDQEQTNGFCYINNVAVAAAYMKYAYREKIKRVAIVDIDVHHGNGTQEIIECMQKPKVFSEPAETSVLWDDDSRKSTQYRPWFDENDGKNVLFQSIHLHGYGFYPNTGGKNTGQEVYEPGGIYNYPLMPGSATSSKWRKVFSSEIIPQLITFRPDVIFVSAGFDAHEKDHIHSPRDTKITEFEYQWATEQLVKVANQFCEGRVISVLEGGYSTKSGPISPLAQSVTHHVRALVQADHAVFEDMVLMVDDQASSAQQQIDDEQQKFMLNQKYFESAKQERSLLKKRRAQFYDELHAATFMRMQLRRKVARTQNEPGQVLIAGNVQEQTLKDLLMNAQNHQKIESNQSNNK